MQEGEGAPETGESAVNSAVKDVMQQGTDFRQELEKGMLRDLEELDAPALRYRIAQLVAEMQERTKWESLRWHEVETWSYLPPCVYIRFLFFSRICSPNLQFSPFYTGRI